MDRKKIYIVVIVICVLVSAGVIYYGFFSSPSIPAPEIITDTGTLPTQSTPTGSAGISGIPTPAGTVTYPVPSVFPQDSSLDLSVYSTAKFRNLQDYTPLTVSPEEIGRENPFVQY